MLRRPPWSPLFPYTTLFRSHDHARLAAPAPGRPRARRERRTADAEGARGAVGARDRDRRGGRSEEHTSELQSLRHLVCRLLLEKKKLKCRYKLKAHKDGRHA